MDSIGRNIGDNFGGIIALQFIPLFFLNSIPDAVDGNVTEDIDLTEDAQIGTLCFTPGFGKYIETEKESNDGNYFNHKIEINIPHADPTVSQWKKDNKGKPGICLIHKTDGQVQMVGTKEEPLYFITNATSGRAFADRDGMDVSFSGDTLQPSVFYKQSVSLAYLIRKVYSSSYSFAYLTR